MQISAFDLSFVESPEQLKDGYVVNANRRDKQSYSRFEAVEAAMNGIARRYPSWNRAAHKTTHWNSVWNVHERAAVFSLRLTDSTFRFRGRDRYFAPGALRPTVAHALVWLSQPTAMSIRVAVRERS